MTTEEQVTCRECGHVNSKTETITALDGEGRRCADLDACHERKEEAASFAA